MTSDPDKLNAQALQALKRREQDIRKVIFQIIKIE
jgi:hypothetical protein